MYHHHILVIFLVFYKIAVGYTGIQAIHQLRICSSKSLLGLHSSRTCASDYLWQPRRDRNCNWLCPWELFFLFVCVCVCTRMRERDCLLSFARSGFNPALSFSSSLMLPNAAIFHIFGVESAKGSFREHLAPEISEGSLLPLQERRGRQQKQWQSSGLKARREQHRHTKLCLCHAEGLRQQSSARSCWGSWRGHSSPPLCSSNSLFLPEVPIPAYRMLGTEQAAFTPGLRAGTEETGLFSTLRSAVEGCELIPPLLCLPQRPWCLERCAIPHPNPALLTIVPWGWGTTVACWFAKAAPNMYPPDWRCLSSTSALVSNLQPKQTWADRNCYQEYHLLEVNRLCIMLS